MALRIDSREAANSAAVAKRWSRLFSSALKMIAFELRRHLRVRVHLRDRRRLLGDVLEDVAVRVRGLERRAAGEHLVHHDAERIEIAARIEMLAFLEKAGLLR